MRLTHLSSRCRCASIDDSLSDPGGLGCQLAASPIIVGLLWSDVCPEAMDTAGLSALKRLTLPCMFSLTSGDASRPNMDESSLVRAGDWNCAMLGRTSSKSMSCTCMVSLSGPPCDPDPGLEESSWRLRRIFGRESFERREFWRAKGGGDTSWERPLCTDIASVSVDGRVRDDTTGWGWGEASRGGSRECEGRDWLGREDSGGDGSLPTGNASRDSDERAIGGDEPCCLNSGLEDDCRS